ncbi:related to alcohol oxidase [Rhynchosporium graminicola]|uniref:Related to alcohol oxidase n=1 Tax=Rhynchosporium graminicola TaxID=2792576 RepID=A0A1E1KE54_9HELO|nr:related to alcohol oxidase [Rhynchosporium commune]
MFILLLWFSVWLNLADARRNFPGKVLKSSSDALQTYDYVVVGGGLTGLVVAGRLSEHSEITVLVIEAGGFTEDEDWITNPLITSSNIPGFKSPKGSKYDWNMISISQSYLSNRVLPLSAGKVVGGGSTINGMVFNRGSKEEYDRWESLGNPGWNFEEMVSYFKKAEIATPPHPILEVEGWEVGYNPAYHGDSGNVHTSFASFVWPSTKYLINAMRELAVTIIPDAMGGTTSGAYWFMQSVDPTSETRSTSEEFIHHKRQNLHLLIDNTVTRINIKSGRAQSVEYAVNKDAKIHSVQASKEVILAAGALRTPQVLQLSGIGEKSHLSKLGIKTVVNLAGVGENYHDHTSVFTTGTGKLPPYHGVNIVPNVGSFSNASWAAEQLELYKSKKQGPYTTLGGNFFAFLPVESFTNATALFSDAMAQPISHYLPPSTPREVRAGYEAQFDLLANDILASSVTYMEFIFSDALVLPALQQPFSRGTIKINTTSAFNYPVIDPRHLSNPLDLALFVASFEYARKIRNTDAMKAINTTETYPGPSVTTKEQIEKFVRGGVNSEHHHAGTASMLPRKLGGVVDPELKVYGVRGLRVVDASIVPMLPGAHLQATLYGIAEKASCLFDSKRLPR